MSYAPFFRIADRTASFCTLKAVAYNTCMKQKRLAGFAAARALSAVSPVAAGIAAVRAAFEVTINDSLKPSHSDSLKHYAFLLFFAESVFSTAVRTYNRLTITVSAEVEESAALLACLIIIC